MRQVRWRHAPSRFHRLLTLTTDCHLAQDIYTYVLRRYRPCPTATSWRFPPFRWMLLFAAFSVVWRVGGNRLRGISGGPLPWRPPSWFHLGLSFSHSHDTSRSCLNSPRLSPRRASDSSCWSSYSRARRESLCWSSLLDKIPRVRLVRVLSSSRFLVFASPS